jgi:muramidase (phage lysozyme)
MNKYEKALLDLIAWAEGTLGVSQNGYDVVVDFYRIIGWTPDTTIVHGGAEWNKPGGSNSTAAGRYQFLFGTWKSINGKVNAPMTKENQYKAAIKLVNKRLKKTFPDNRPVTINELENRQKFDIMLTKLAPEWASFPVTKDLTTHDHRKIKAGQGYYSGQGGRKTPDKMYEIYKKALALYS